MAASLWEHMEKLRRRCNEVKRLKSRSVNHPYDNARPWNIAFMAAVTDSLWWTHEVVDSLTFVVVMSKASNLTVQLFGDTHGTYA
eukprot:4256667-Amphidinium_carterae.2